ncbi:hypothetical protein BpHYR1_030999 [Brachionus plicatilis]|uniref:Uncharacterized protein n=1 Tax=Brachionus plicatilis TaxID=10195 RepID=A0A3M7T6A5_BRAPC|nr:hypothetical protein BpHYR1_030999 [Brachionus plicatilis]
MSNLNQKKESYSNVNVSGIEIQLQAFKYAYVSIDSKFPARDLLSDVEIISSVNNTALNDDSDYDVEEIEKPKQPVISSKRSYR